MFFLSGEDFRESSVPDQQDDERDDREHLASRFMGAITNPWMMHGELQNRFDTLSGLCMTGGDARKSFRVPNPIHKVDIEFNVKLIVDDIVVLRMLDALHFWPKFPVIVLQDVISAFCDWLSCTDKGSWQRRSVNTALEHFLAQLLLFATLLEIKAEHFPDLPPGEGRTSLQAAILNHVPIPSGHNNADYQLDDEHLAAELIEQEEIFAHMPLSIVKENIAHAKAQYQFIKDLSLPPGWPKTETWIADPTAFLNDFNMFVRMFESLVNFDPEIGSFFAERPAGRLAWIIAIEFVPKIKAVLAVCPLPISAGRLERVLEIVATQDQDDEIERDICDETGKKKATRHTWHPRYTFKQKQALCREAEQILTGEKAAIVEFVRLKSVHTADKGRATKFLPQWLLDERTLMFAGTVVRRFGAQTRNAVLGILSSFEECEWAVRIDDPLSPPDGEKTKLALRTINRGLLGLRFSKDGDGIRWEVVSN